MRPVAFTAALPGGSVRNILDAVADKQWGQRVAAAVVLRAGTALNLDSLRTWARELLAVHKLPSRLLLLEALPRNAMGKVLKLAVTNLFNVSA